MPFGLPVLPEVYNIKSMSSLLRGSGGHTDDSCSMAYEGGGGMREMINDLPTNANSY